MSTIKSIQLQGKENLALRKLISATSQLCQLVYEQRDEAIQYADANLDDANTMDRELDTLREAVDVAAQARGLRFTNSREALDLLVLALRETEEALAEERREHEATRAEFARAEERGFV